MRKSLARLWLPACLAVLTAAASAQQAGAHRGMFLGFRGWGSPPISAVGQVTPLNAWVGFPTQTNGPWPLWGDVYGATQDVDNHGVLVAAYGGRAATTLPAKVGLVVWDPTARAVTSTLWVGSFGGASTPSYLGNLTLNSDGDLVGHDWSLGKFVVFDRLAGRWRLHPGLANRAWGGYGGFEWDRLHGGYLHATGVMGDCQLYRSSWDFASTVLVASGFLNVQAYYGGGVLEDGVWVSSNAKAGTYSIVRPSTGRWEIGPLTRWGIFTDCTPERFSAPGRGYWAGFSGWHSIVNRGIVYADASTSPHTFTGLIGGPFPNGVLSTAIGECLPLFERDLCTQRITKGTWRAIVNPGQGRFAGMPFVLAASLTGATPPIGLPDGRQIFLVPDALTLLSARGALAPFLRGNTGRLDTRGKAYATLDFSAAGTAANGTVIHLCAVVLDPKAPSDIAWVCEPWAFVVNVQP